LGVGLDFGGGLSIDFWPIFVHFLGSYDRKRFIFGDLNPDNHPLNTPMHGMVSTISWCSLLPLLA